MVSTITNSARDAAAAAAAAARSSSENLDSASVQFKRKRRGSAGVSRMHGVDDGDDGAAFDVPPARSSLAAAADAVEFSQPFRSNTSNSNNRDSSTGGLHQHQGNCGATAYSMGSQDFKQSGNGRPRKQSCQGLFPDSSEAAADALRRKQDLIEKLRAYGSGDDEDDYEDDEGDVSGEDVFSEDEVEKPGHDHVTHDAMASFSSIPAASYDQGQVLSNARISAAKLAERPYNQRVTDGAAQKQPSNSFSSDKEPQRANKGSFTQVGLGSQEQPFLGYDTSITANRETDGGSTSSSRDHLLNPLHVGGQERQVHGSHSLNREYRANTRRDYLLRQFHGSHSSIAENREAERSNRASSSQGVDYHSFHHAPKGHNIHSKASTNLGKSSPHEALTKQQEKSRGVFANLEAQILQNDALIQLQHSPSPSTRSPINNLTVRGRDVSNGSGSAESNCSSTGAPSRNNPQNLKRNQREISYRPELRHNRAAEPSNNSLHNEFRRSNRVSPPRSTQSLAATVDDHRHSRNVIANMEAVILQREVDARVSSGRESRNIMPHRADGVADASATDRWESRTMNILESQSFQRRACTTRTERALRGPSREVIASIEADMMRLEEEENRAESDNNRGLRIQHGAIDPHGPNIRSGITYGDRQPAGMNQRDVLNIMMLQQQQRLQQTNGNNTLADQISNMAIDPLQLEANDDNSAKSINSCISYDGKCTNILATRAQTHDQELACHELNNAICDLYGAPVGKILSQYPTVTRLIRAEDESGNIQLHYAVRNGNVKAIRRIIRADPACALIRNVQGYCPLHFAVQIGNFAAVQLLCCMVPASAEVQCEEGCLPLHEAVSSAAHLPDAPQILAALINAFPSAIKITNDEGLLPLHLCAMSGFSAGIRTIFAYGFSTVYARENTEEMLPLDFAIEGYKASLEEREEANEEASDDTAMAEKEREFRQCIDIFLMSALYDRPVFTPARSDRRGSTFLPIHGAAAAQPCSLSWKQIVSMYGKDYANDVDVRGRTALHVLVTSTLSHHLEIVTEMISDINDLDPTSATTFDDSGLIPLHAALIHLVPYPVIEYLLACKPATVSMEVDEDCDYVQYRRMLPFQLAAACGCSTSIVNMLFRAHPIGVLGAIN